MGINFKEVASLRCDDTKFQENFSKIDWSAHKKKCGECNGKGKVAYDIDPFNPSKDLWETCKDCDGTGE